MTVLDASALLAFLFEEPGADVVEDAILRGATISTVNIAEVLSKLSDRGGDLGSLVLPEVLAIEPFTADDARVTSGLRPATRDKDVSLGDRACLALGLRLALPVLTADRAWRDLPDEVVGDVELIR